MEVTLSAELSSLIACQQALKNKIEKQIILSIIVTMVVALSSKLSFGLLFVTLVTLIFLTVTMQDSILNLQRNLFTICYQQLHSQDSQSQERQEPLGQ